MPFLNVNRSFISWDESSWLKFPVIRIFYSGASAVAVFFTLSGFVLLMKPLALASQGSPADVFRSLSSSVFRRTWRLVLPCLPATFLVMLATYLRMFDLPFDGGEITVGAPLVQNNIILQIWDLVSFLFWSLLDVWTFKPLQPKSNYGPHLWTIPFELRDSMILYVCILGIIDLNNTAFLLSAVSILSFSLAHGAWDVSLFFGGLTIVKCEEILRPARIHPRVRELFSAAALLLAIYLASLPPDPAGRFGLGGNQLTMGCGTLLLLAAVTSNHGARQFLSRRPFIFLGDISFSLYILHEPTLRLFGYRLVA